MRHHVGPVPVAGVAVTLDLKPHHVVSHARVDSAADWLSLLASASRSITMHAGAIEGDDPALDVILLHEEESVRAHRCW